MLVHVPRLVVLSLAAWSVLVCLTSGAAAEPATPAAGTVRTVRTVRIEHRPAGAAPALGPKLAPVQVELFFLPGATSSRTPLQLALELWRAHPARVRLVFRVLSRQGQVHLPAAALEAAAQGKFLPFMDAVAQRLRGTALPQIRELAQSVGMDLEQLEAAWQDNRHLEQLERNDLRRARLRARQTPEIAFSGKLASRPVTVLGSTDFEAAYREALDRAAEARDRGVAEGELAEVLEREALAGRLSTVVALGPADERRDTEDLQLEPSSSLLTSPVRTSGLPVLRAATAPGLPVLVACNPLSVLCYRQLQLAVSVAGLVQDRVRVLWAPMFDPRGRDALVATQVADAILCAEAMGSGWIALDLVTAQTNSRRGPVASASEVIDDLIEAADLDGRALARCLAELAGASVRRAGELRSAGMVATPTLVVGGRMYPGGVSDSSSLQNLIELELADGWLGALVGR